MWKDEKSLDWECGQDRLEMVMPIVRIRTVRVKEYVLARYAMILSQQHPILRLHREIDQQLLSFIRESFGNLLLVLGGRPGPMNIQQLT